MFQKSGDSFEIAQQSRVTDQETVTQLVWAFSTRNFEINSASLHLSCTSLASG